MLRVPAIFGDQRETGEGLSKYVTGRTQEEMGLPVVAERFEYLINLRCASF
jgi:hypothetical protein